MIIDKVPSLETILLIDMNQFTNQQTTMPSTISQKRILNVDEYIAQQNADELDFKVADITLILYWLRKFFINTQLYKQRQQLAI